MEELLTLRSYIEQQRYAEALELVTEIETMSQEDKINKIRSFTRILLLHLIKQHAEKRSTRSWELSIRNAAREIYFINQRRKAGGTYLTEAELREVVAEAYQPALETASLEAFEGVYDDERLGQMVNRNELEKTAVEIIQAYQG